MDFFQINHSVGVTKTVGTSWVVKCSLKTEALPLATYRVGWTFSYKVESKDKELKPTFKAVLRLNDNKNVREIKTQPIVGANAILSTGFTYWELEDVNTISFEFRRLGDAGIVSVSDVILEFWKATDAIFIAPDDTGSKNLVEVSVEPIAFQKINL
jgi:hypothetical protein